MPIIIFFTGLLQKMGIPGCVVLVCAISATGAWTAEERYAKHSDFAQIAKRQIAQDIREVRSQWCKATPDKKSYWWKQLQNHQDEYREITKKGQYELPPCPSTG